ncbi:hypothetical protein QZH41_007978 [Actinostola sp. cb2023]|nr:hypothetical protein QZH41_007978 [Actinostola sp. cb2023]
MAEPLNLGGKTGETERDETFWNRSVVFMKSTVEEKWLGMVNKAKTKPDYGMRDLDPIMEERMLNKLELAGPMVDSYLKHIGLSMQSKLGRSKNTGLLPPTTVFIPWSIFRHICMLVVGYGGDMKTTQRTIELTIYTTKTAKKVLSPVRIGGINCLKKRNFQRVKEDGKFVSRVKGRAAVLITKKCPINFTYNRRQETVCVSY